ncbi:MAG TPA: hypothetical protein VLZ09_09270 [Gaiellaceae bacterium]|nr:hypothetical protein [Gaiellaceae bacterium]
MKAGRGDDVTIKALEALTEVTSVKNVTITGCTITAKDGGRHGRD